MTDGSAPSARSVSAAHPSAVAALSASVKNMLIRQHTPSVIGRGSSVG
jgi:hypothetical protein